MAFSISSKEIQEALDALKLASAQTPAAITAAPVPGSPLQGALTMAALGVPVAPVKAKDKFPPIDDFPNLATTDQTQIVAWAQARPNCNWLVLAKPDGVCFIDEDDTDRLRTLYEQRYNEPYPDTRSTESRPGHRQSCWKQTDRTRAFGNRVQGHFVDKMLSFRQSNEYCLCEGSVHPSGSVYQGNDKPILEMPGKLMDLIESLRTDAAVKKDANKSEGKNTPYVPLQPGEKVTECRNNACHDYAFHRWTKDCVPVEQLIADVYAFNAEHCDPPLEQSELDNSVIKSVQKFRPNWPVLSGGVPIGTAQPATPVRKTLVPGLHDGGDLTVEQMKEYIHELIYTTAKHREATGLPGSIKKAINEAAVLIYEHLKKRGEFFNSEGVGYLLLDQLLIKIAPDDAHFMNMLTEFVGVLPGQEEMMRVGKFIGMKATIEGTKTVVRVTSHYNDKTKSFYYADGNSLIKGDGNSLERVPNGTDGELFRLDLNEPGCINLDSIPVVENSLVCTGLIASELFGDLAFKDTTLDPDGKQVLLITHMLLCILAGISKDRVSLQFIGPTGCRKTTQLRKMGRTIRNLSFEVTPLPEDPREFENILVNNEIAFFDNVDYVHPKIRSLICQACTGIIVKRRELFTTTGEISMMSKATLGFSGLTDILTGGEQANRSIRIDLLEHPDGMNISENALMEEFGKKRPALLLEILVRANMVVRALAAESSYIPRVKSRMADFASIILKVARYEGWHARAQEILESWDADQHDAALYNDDLSEALSKWMTQSNWKPAPVFAQELNAALLGLGYGSDSSWKANSRSLSVKLKKSQKAYHKRFGLVIVDDKHTGTPTFTFQSKSGTITKVEIEQVAGAVMLDPAGADSATAMATDDSGRGSAGEGYIMHPRLGLVAEWGLSVKEKEELCS